MIVGTHTIVNERRAMELTLSHFLLLIVAGELRGVQRVPLEPETDRQAEERYTRSSSPPIHCLLQKHHRPLGGIAERAVVTHICQEPLLEHKNLAADMCRMQVTAIDQRIPLRGVEHVTCRDPDILGFARLQHHFGFHHKG